MSTPELCLFVGIGILGVGFLFAVVGVRRSQGFRLGTVIVGHVGVMVMAGGLLVMSADQTVDASNAAHPTATEASK